MTVTEDDIIYSYGQMREQIRIWINQKMRPTLTELAELLDQYPENVGDEDDE